jgi:hypothetical protein
MNIYRYWSPAESKLISQINQKVVKIPFPAEAIFSSATSYVAQNLKKLQ